MRPSLRAGSVFGLQVVLRVVPAAALALRSSPPYGRAGGRRLPCATAALVWCVAGCVSLALSDIACRRTGDDKEELLRCKIR